MRAHCWACVLASTLLFGIACGQAPKAADAAKPASPHALSPDELAKYLETPDKVYFLDVRSKEEIEKLGSVKGYKHIPLSELEKRLSEVPKDKLIVTL
jgi:hypothetical protein